ncbi:MULTISPECIES: DUF308 domain-containing protein [Bradyrhizobium]|uniref:Uncharacterized membrane protein HdeD (DUF308 family) n=1 Tax=Bradyrhizobium ottawaense TaxID=931866 RepID=A0A2U8P4Y6_9BRAD|nr:MULTISPECIES: DUF308 domain-containing protein [Bradyrhizobium]AWL92805.1 hypothetical protein CIT37_11735 [Bradyrhizobium ottawaense]MBR1288480.1 hypothetical protein [Bradyrhizobium ottawaense]MBR1326538.1 hypothetical protein [Bradyrhizobium ottawaense]MBR1332185.1 hypothetical protein [Bradyrhizobium ottawaense]MBR1367775.1 hypothetical protein [Bradyrhizobium ottawaense]
MSETPPLPPSRSGCVTALMVMFGVILLLPGICALIFAFDQTQSSHFDTRFTPILALALLVAFAGVMLIRAARKRP